MAPLPKDYRVDVLDLKRLDAEIARCRHIIAFTNSLKMRPELAAEQKRTAHITDVSSAHDHDVHRASSVVSESE